SPPTTASDVYAMGVMLFVALTGRLPFPGASEDALEAKREQDAPEVRKFAAHAPSDLAELCSTMLARSPEQRPALDKVVSLVGSSHEPQPTRRRFVAASSLFVGRDAELQLLRAAFSEV